MIINFFEKLHQRMTGIDVEPAKTDLAKEVEHYQRLDHSYRLQFAREKIPHDASVETLDVLSRHQDGYVRQAALERLNVLDSTASLKLAIVRLNDWVPAIRQTASRLVHARINEENAEVVVACLDEIVRLFEQSRDNHEKTLQAVESLLAMPSVRPKLLTRFKMLKASTARYTFAFVSKWPEDQFAAALPIIVQHSDCLLRMKVLAICKADPAQYTSLIRLFLDDSQPSIRAAAIHVAMESTAHGIDHNDVMENGLLDESAGVCDAAHWYARQRGFNVLKLIDAELANQHNASSIQPSLINLMGLQKNYAYHDRLTAATSNVCAKVRLAAYRALLLLPEADQESLVLQMLKDPSQRVFRFATRHCAKNNLTPALHLVKQLVHENLALLNGKRVSALLAFLPVWERLEYLLQLITVEGDAQNINLLNEMAVEWIVAKRNCFSSIPASLQDSIDGLLLTMQNKVPTINCNVISELTRIGKDWRH